MPRFELRTLDDYDDSSLIAEIRRVIDVLPPGPLTRKAFDAVARVSSYTLVKRFGGWYEALRKAGRGDRYSGRTVSSKMRRQHTRRLTNAQLVAELQAVARKMDVRTITMEQFNRVSGRANSAGVKRRFGSWKAALNEAGLELSPLGRRYSDDEYFENILGVWTHYGRQPKYREMNDPPSIIPSGAYEAKFGGWRKALAAFVSRVNSDRVAHGARPPTRSAAPQRARGTSPGPSRVRTISVSLRYDVLRRDNFKCVLCGVSPATNPTAKLHVDHIVSFSRGGPTKLSNLRTLCARCNIGKGNKLEEGAV